MPVVSGGHDHICGALASGITEPGHVLDSMGTAEGLMISLSQPVLDPHIAQAGYAQGVHVVPARYCCLGGLYSSGACVDWARALLCPDLDATHGYVELIRLAASARPGANGVLFLPHLRMGNAPRDDPKSRGAFIGLTADTARADMARAVFEGLAYEAQLSLVGMIERLGVEVQQIRAIGGGSRNHLWMEIKAAVANHPFSIASVSDATTLGAAILAGVGTGVYRDHNEALAQISFAETMVTPDAHLTQLYQTYYESFYIEMYDTLRQLNHRITDHFTTSGEFA